MQLSCDSTSKMPSFARQFTALVRNSRLARPSHSEEPPLPTVANTSFASCHYQLNLSSSASKDDCRENWVKVIELYSTKHKQVARDLGVTVVTRARM
jgi:hypothetical protein